MVTTSWSRDLDSFLSMPASLPGMGREGRDEAGKPSVRMGEGIYAAVNSGSLLTWDGTTGGSRGGGVSGDAHEYASS